MKSQKDPLLAAALVVTGAGILFRFPSPSTLTLLGDEMLGALLFAVFMLSANLCIGFGARIACRVFADRPHRRSAAVAGIAGLTLAFLALLFDDLRLSIQFVDLIANTGVIAISELAAMVSWVTAFSLVWLEVVSDPRYQSIGRVASLLMALCSSLLFFAEPLCHLLCLDMAMETAASKYALTCLVQSFAIATFVATRPRVQKVQLLP